MPSATGSVPLALLARDGEGVALVLERRGEDDLVAVAVEVLAAVVVAIAGDRRLVVDPAAAVDGEGMAGKRQVRGPRAAVAGELGGAVDRADAGADAELGAGVAV